MKRTIYLKRQSIPVNSFPPIVKLIENYFSLFIYNLKNPVSRRLSWYRKEKISRWKESYVSNSKRDSSRRLILVTSYKMESEGSFERHEARERSIEPGFRSRRLRNVTCVSYFRMIGCIEMQGKERRVSRPARTKATCIPSRAREHETIWRAECVTSSAGNRTFRFPSRAKRRCTQPKLADDIENNPTAPYLRLLQRILSAALISYADKTF